jgi:outer membrane lipoprotein-sorting protein
MKTAFVLFFFFVVSLFVRSSYGAAFLPLKFTAKFTQEYKSVVTGKVKKGHGHFDYQFPGMLRFEMQKPTPLIFITRANQNWYYRPPFVEGEDGEVRKNVNGGQAISKFFDALSEGLENNKYYKVSKKNKTNIEIKFNESSAHELGIDSAVLNFKTKTHSFLQLSSINLNYVDGKKNKILFEKISLVDEFSKLNFVFKENNPPKIRK